MCIRDSINAEYGGTLARHGECIAPLSRRKRTSQRLNTGVVSQRQATMSPGTKVKMQRSYADCAANLEDAFPTKDAEWKATQRARAAQPKDSRKRAKVMMNLMGDKESEVFAEAIGATNPKELTALRLLAANIRELVQQHEGKGGVTARNEVRHFRKVVATLVASDSIKNYRLLQETSRLTGLDHRRLLKGIVFRERMLKGDVNALFAQQRYAASGNRLLPETILKIVDYYATAGATDPGAKQATRNVRNAVAVSYTHLTLPTKRIV
eukprot:TRINITY_DN7361_c0_g2_i2.p1 TRINITY_DN7361_c0_g2~~TRINITY_DN7361_c0_g2_i2.p1  ORF type:complete len:267 (+),score=61.61 TRINITY_DN7361_c0_g2_i2:186-986(+)